MSITDRASAEAQPIAVHYEAGFIVVSYLISLVGCITTLELLHRRTSNRGLYNWYLLITSSITMGGIGIWSMHFVGNRAIVLADGQADQQLSYNQGFTALSFFLPIIVLVPAFYVLAISVKASRINILIAGLLTGTAVCAMHYVGQVGIANYNCSYQISHIVGAAIIALTASFIALSIFFRLRENWTDSWWKRVLCAGILAGAVSGMHWTAAVGTSYRVGADMSRDGHSRAQTVIFCAVLSIASCVLLLSIAFITRRRSLAHRRRAQELVLACAYFDDDGRVMVSHDGFLPFQKITNQFVRKTFAEDELNRSHPVFIWVYEATRNWTTLAELVPSIQDYLDANPAVKKYQPGHEHSIDFARAASGDFNILFKQLFCVAARRLATQVHQPMEKLGILFEEPLETGSMKPEKSINKRLSGLNPTDPEKKPASKVLGRGRYFFLNRRLSKNEVDDFAALGYRFGSTSHLAESLARKMQVSHDDMLSLLERMKICTSKEHLHPAGIHLASFVLRPSIHAGFDILVPTERQNQLPLVTLPITELSPSHMTLLQSIDGWTIRDILKELITEDNSASQEKDFRWQLYTSFVRFVDMIRDTETMMNARFSGKPVRAPCRSPEGNEAPATCILFAVRYLGNIHTPHNHNELTYVPFDFFGAQQVVETSSTRHEVFKRRTHVEFGECAELSRIWTHSQTEAVTDNELNRPVSGRSSDPDPQLSTRIRSWFGYDAPKRSRSNSKSAMVTPSRSVSGRSTVEEADSSNQSSPVSRKKPNVSTVKPEVSEPTSNKQDEITTTTARRKGREIELSLLTDVKGTFVSELFAMFQLSSVAAAVAAAERSKSTPPPSGPAV